MFATYGIISGLLGAVREQPIVTRTLIALVVLYRVNAIGRFNLIYMLTQPWFYKPADYQVWRHFGLFFVIESRSIQALIAIYQLYRNSKGVELSYFGGDSFSYAFFLAFCMTISSICTAVMVASNKSPVGSLFPALQSFLLYTWSVMNKETMVNYFVFTVRGKYLPLIGLGIDAMSGSSEVFSISCFGLLAAYIYCSIDCGNYDPLFNNAPTVGGKLRGRTLLDRFLGSTSRLPGRSSSRAKAKRLSTSSPGSFKGEGRRLHDGKAVTNPRESIFSKIGLTGGGDSGTSGSGTVRLISSESLFYQAIAANNLVIVDFFATWCGPCKKLAPYLEKLAAEHRSVSFYKVDVDQLQFISAKYDVFSMPTIIAFRMKKEKSRVTGLDLTGVQRLINSHA